MRYYFVKTEDKAETNPLSDQINITSLEFIEIDKFDLRLFNKFIRVRYSYFPVMTNSDVNSLINNGRSIIYIKRDRVYKISYLIIDLDHPKNKYILRDFKIENLIKDV